MENGGFRIFFVLILKEKKNFFDNKNDGKIDFFDFITRL